MNELPLSPPKLTRSINEHKWEAAIQFCHEKNDRNAHIVEIHHPYPQKFPIWVFWVKRSLDVWERHTSYVEHPDTLQFFAGL